MRIRILLFLLMLELIVPPAYAQTSYSGPYAQGVSAPQSSFPEVAVPSFTQAGQPANLEDPSAVFVSGSLSDQVPSFSSRPAWAQQAYDNYSANFPPFGANLFQGYFAGTYYQSMNPDYVVGPGDRILINMWGTHRYNDVAVVDQQGNIFLPEVGPALVAGTRHANLSATVRNYLSRAYTGDIQLYVNLLTAQPSAVYVTGFVARPGRYAGGATENVLYYLDRAGGILPDRGSYRDITIRRDNSTVARVDLYPFILEGRISGGILRDGDVIVVGPRKNSVNVGGLIPQQAAYESLSDNFTGADLSTLAAPLPAASHVSVTGIREETPFHVYLSRQEFASFVLAGNDRVEYLADRPSETIMVSVSGSILGPTRYPVQRSVTLRSLLGHVPVDPALSNLDGIYIKRRSVVEQESKAISDALRRLEQSVLTSTSYNNESAAIRVQEAQLVRQFVEQARQVVPDGVVVVTREGVTADIILEDGDEIIIPQKSDVVQVTGEVNIAKALVHMPDQGVLQYVRGSGGFTGRADRGNILIVHPNGEIFHAGDTAVQPGDLLMVMPRNEVKGFSIFKDIVQIMYQIALATKVVIDI